MTGKYSPTVQDHPFVPTEPNGIFDAEGFDAYGYNADGVDRVGKREYDYQREALREEGLLVEADEERLIAADDKYYEERELQKEGPFVDERSFFSDEGRDYR